MQSWVGKDRIYYHNALILCELESGGMTHT